ncbi:MAG: ABC transporter ATP-binding protein [Betaproteobacteria bacterium]
MSLLEVSHLAKAFGGVQAVADVSFQLQSGEMLALIGPNGAGKSTCFNLLNGQLRPDSGTVTLDGREVTGMRPRGMWWRGVARTFQVTETFNSMSVRENVQTVLLSRARAMLGLWRPADQRFRSEALALLAQVGMAAQAERICGLLAYGDVKRVELAMALASAPSTLLLDEPTAGMGPKERNDLMALIAKLTGERRMGVLFTEHSMDMVFTYAHRVLVMARGKLIAQGAPQSVRDDPQVQAVYLGTGAAYRPRAGAL